jgi:hypothetical protein
MNQRWLAMFSGIVGLFLLGHGYMVASVIPPASHLVFDPINPFGTEENIAQIKGMLPYMYLAAVQGIVLGAFGLAVAAAFVAGWKRALPALLLGSALLAVSAIAAMIVAPGSWDIQLLWVLFSGALWWKYGRAKSRNESAI